MWSDRDRLAEAWRAAAIDLEIRVTAPYALRDRRGESLEFIACVHDFGARRGTLVWMMPEPLPAARLPVGVFHFFSVLHPDVHGEYERERFVQMLETWGWEGPGAPPDWYRGP